MAKTDTKYLKDLRKILEFNYKYEIRKIDRLVEALENDYCVDEKDLAFSDLRHSDHMSTLLWCLKDTYHLDLYR